MFRDDVEYLLDCVAARVLGVSAAEVRVMFRSGDLTGFVEFGHVFVDAAEVESLRRRKESGEINAA